MSAYRDELDAARERVVKLETELEETRTRVGVLEDALRERDEQIDGLRRKFNGSPARGRRYVTVLRSLGIALVGGACIVGILVSRGPDEADAKDSRPPEAEVVLADPVQVRGDQDVDGVDTAVPNVIDGPSETAGHEYAEEAQARLDRNDLAGAESFWRKAIDANDNVLDWHFRLGVLLFERGRRAEALPHLERALSLSSETGAKPVWAWRAHLFVGKATESSDPKRALTAYDAFLELSTSENVYRPEALRAKQALRQKLRASH